MQYDCNIWNLHILRCIEMSYHVLSNLAVWRFFIELFTINGKAIGLMIDLTMERFDYS